MAYYEDLGIKHEMTDDMLEVVHSYKECGGLVHKDILAVITKEAFVECYNKWILGKEDDSPHINLHTKTNNCSNCVYFDYMPSALNVIAGCCTCKNSPHYQYQVHWCLDCKEFKRRE